ncbi:MAG: hypothetical protein SOR86_02800 [Sodaliphilus sp.]|nr:hypothetical protein [Sodaliphilus sp.]
MKRSFYILAFAASALFIGSCQKEGKGTADTASDADTIPVEQVLDTDTTANGNADSMLSVQGVAVGGAMNSIFVEDNQKESHDFAYPELNRDSIDAWEEGDIVKVTYAPGAEGDVVSSVRVIRHTAQ